MNVIDWAERRIKRRHKAPDLKLTIRTTGLKRWLAPTVYANCIDFNRYGMAITSVQRLKAGDCVVISFKGKYILQSNVPAVVTECIQTKTGYRASLRFAYAMDSRKYCRKIDNALSRIESIYNAQEDPEGEPSVSSKYNLKNCSSKSSANHRLNSQKRAS